MSKELEKIYASVCRITGTPQESNVDIQAAILKQLQVHETQLKQQKRQETKNRKRINEILKVIISFAALRYDKKASISKERNDLDALAAGINMLGEELRASTVSLHEKEILLKEIHHRVKNNLQVISSLLNLQSEKIVHPDFLRIFTESQNRIRAMALVHEKLYESSDLSRIDFTKYINSFLIYMDISYNMQPESVQLHTNFNTDSHYFKIDTAIACGLILNELITNSCKYAFPDKRSGNIYLYFGREKQSDKTNSYVLQVADDGIGIPPHIEIENTNTLGLQLISMLTNQIQGTMELDRSIGTKFTIRFDVENTATASPVN